MRIISVITIVSAIANYVAAAEAKQRSISLDEKGNTTGEIAVLAPGDSVQFKLPAETSLRYQLSDTVGDGKLLLPACSGGDSVGIDYDSKPIQIKPFLDDGLMVKRPTRALYFNLIGPAPRTADDDKTLDDLNQQRAYLNSKLKDLTWTQRQKDKDAIVELSDQITQYQEEIKAYAGTSLSSATEAIEKRQSSIRELRRRIKEIQQEIDGSDIDLRKQIEKIAGQIKELTDRSGKILLRAGVLVIGEDKKPLYYTLKKGDDPSAPWLLTHFQKFPTLTTNDKPYVVILGQRFQQEPLGLRVSFTTKAGSYLNADPVRPMITQDTVKGAQAEAAYVYTSACPKVSLSATSYVDRVLPFTERLAGETVYLVTVSGYGTITQTDTVSVTTGLAPANQKQTVIAKTAVTALNAEALPQVHSLYRYNLSTGVVWSTIRTPTFSRVATGNYLPAECVPSTSLMNTAGTSSTTTGTTTTTSGSTSTTTGTTTTTSPGSSTTASCAPTYQTLEVAGGPRIIPALMFTIYPTKRDTQVRTVSWKEVIPAPTLGLSLTSPKDDFFLGASSELKPFRNLQLVYGLHLGRVAKLGANGFQNPLDSAAPQTTTSLHTGAFVGVMFNIDFIKGLFKP